MVDYGPHMHLAGTREESYPHVNDSAELKGKLQTSRTVAEYFDFAAGVLVGVLLLSVGRCMFCRRREASAGKKKAT